MRFAYTNNGRPLLSWKGGTAPNGTRAADAKALGSLGGPTLELPRAGAPEPLGCCTTPMAGVSEVVDKVKALSTPAKIGLGLAAYFLFKKIAR